jgi:hypothetical protein
VSVINCSEFESLTTSLFQAVSSSNGMTRRRNPEIEVVLYGFSITLGLIKSLFFMTELSMIFLQEIGLKVTKMFKR